MNTVSALMTPALAAERQGRMHAEARTVRLTRAARAAAGPPRFGGLRLPRRIVAAFRRPLVVGGPRYA
jgi:hypothetical protein